MTALTCAIECWYAAVSCDREPGHEGWHRYDGGGDDDWLEWAPLDGDAA